MKIEAKLLPGASARAAQLIRTGTDQGEMIASQWRRMYYYARQAARECGLPDSHAVATAILDGMVV